MSFYNGLFDFEIVILLILLWLYLAFEHLIIGLIGIICCMFLTYFTRTWDGKFDNINGVVISPCEGKIVNLESVYKYNQLFTRVEIFLGLNNIHFQYVPYDGQIIYQWSELGGFYPAKWQQARNNLKICTLIQTEFGLILLEQVSGLLVRKIKTFKTTGDTIVKSEPFGMIKFGSRCHLYLPSNSVKMLISSHEQLKIGQPLAVISNLSNSK